MSGINRRRFLWGAGALAACGLGAAARFSGRWWWERPGLRVEGPAPGGQGAVSIETQPGVGRWTVEARYYTSFVNEGSLNCSSCHEPVEDPLPVSYCHTPHAGTYVQCSLCPHRCIISEGQRGTCRVRENRGGRLYSVVYGNPCAVHVDPIEKKPFYHFLPTATALSVATAGCNLRCLYCQNWSISQVPPEETENADLPPEAVVSAAREQQIPIIAYTYSEPTAFYEYMLATARLGREAGVRSVVISSGFIEPEPLRELCGVVDAIKVDLKGYDEEFYRKICSAELGPVLKAIETIYESGVHLEIVNLVVPTLNDSLDQLRVLSRWVAHQLGPDVPLHFSRFQPEYKLPNLPPTPVETLERAHQIALEEGNHFVYVGNVPGHPADNTYCPNCNRAIIVRQGFSVTEYHLREGACAYCGTAIPGVWWQEGLEGNPVKVPPGPPDL